MWPLAKRRVSARVAPEAYEEVLVALNRLANGGADGLEYRIAVRHWNYSTRPIVEHFVGEDFHLLVEGPMESVRGLDYPLGAQIRDRDGWRWLNPIQTCSLVRALRKAQDRAFEDWLKQNEIAGSPNPMPRNVDRDVEDPKWIARIHRRANLMIHFLRSHHAV